MNKPSLLSVICSAVVLSVASAGEPAKPAAAPAAAAFAAAFPKGKYAQLEKLPDWGGVWALARRAPGGPPREQPALKGEYLAKFEAWQKAVRDTNGLAPRDTSNCMPPGMPNMLATGQYPIEFLFTPGRVTVLHEAWMQQRTIFTDGRPHPDDWEGGIFGHSTGKWEGDTLVVDTIGIKTITEMGPGLKHSYQMHITERIHLDPKDANKLVFEVKIEDPEALSKPYNITHTYDRKRDWNLMEFVCAENDRNPVDEKGQTQFH